MTIFPDDENRKLRVFLYQLETLGIIRFKRKKEEGFQNYSWELTSKGENFLKEDESLKKLLKEGQIFEFCQKAIYKLNKN